MPRVMWSGRAPILLEEFEESFLARGELSTRGWEDLLKKPDLLSHGSSIEQIFMCFFKHGSHLITNDVALEPGEAIIEFSMELLRVLTRNRYW